MPPKKTSKNYKSAKPTAAAIPKDTKQALMDIFNSAAKSYKNFIIENYFIEIYQIDKETIENTERKTLTYPGIEHSGETYQYITNRLLTDICYGFGLILAPFKNMYKDLTLAEIEHVNTVLQSIHDVIDYDFIQPVRGFSNIMSCPFIPDKTELDALREYISLPIGDVFEKMFEQLGSAAELIMLTMQNKARAEEEAAREADRNAEELLASLTKSAKTKGTKKNTSKSTVKPVATTAAVAEIKMNPEDAKKQKEREANEANRLKQLAIKETKEAEERAKREERQRKYELSLLEPPKVTSPKAPSPKAPSPKATSSKTSKNPSPKAPSPKSTSSKTSKNPSPKAPSPKTSKNPSPKATSPKSPSPETSPKPIESTINRSASVFIPKPLRYWTQYFEIDKLNELKDYVSNPQIIGYISSMFPNMLLTDDSDQRYIHIVFATLFVLSEITKHVPEQIFCLKGGKIIQMTSTRPYVSNDIDILVFNHDKEVATQIAGLIQYMFPGELSVVSKDNMQSMTSNLIKISYILPNNSGFKPLIDIDYMQVPEYSQMFFSNLHKMHFGPLLFVAQNPTQFFDEKLFFLMLYKKTLETTKNSDLIRKADFIISKFQKALQQLSISLRDNGIDVDEFWLEREKFIKPYVYNAFPEFKPFDAH